MPLLRPPVTLLEAALSQLTRDVEFRVRKIISSTPYVHMRDSLLFLKRVIQSLPQCIRDILMRAALQCADVCCERTAIRPDNLRVLVDHVIHENTQSLPISTLPVYSHQLRQALLRRISSLRCLKAYYCLDNPYETYGMLEILRELPSLPNLREIYIPTLCTDEIASLLGQSCPNLMILDAESSGRLTDMGVTDTGTSLINCKGLKVLLVESSGISDEGREELLDKLPHLKKIGYCDNLNTIIVNIKKKRQGLSLLSLTEFESNEFPNDDVADMCPNLCTVNVKEAINYSEQTLPTQVANFKIAAPDLWNRTAFLHKMLTANIVQLELELITDFEMITNTAEALVTTIASKCVSLRVLVLICPPGHFVIRLPNRSLVFRNLEVLDLIDTQDFRLAADILKVSPRIRRFTMQERLIVKHSPPVFWPDDLLHEILSQNPMECLEHFHICIYCKISLDIIHKLVDACPKLKHLGDCSLWGYTEKVIDDIRREFKERNLAITLP